MAKDKQAKKQKVAAPRNNAYKEARTQKRKEANRAKYAPTPFRIRPIRLLAAHATTRLRKLKAKMMQVGEDRRAMMKERIGILEAFVDKASGRVVLNKETVKLAFPNARISKA
jgi:hypothetical protein